MEKCVRWRGEETTSFEERERLLGEYIASLPEGFLSPHLLLELLSDSDTRFETGLDLIIQGIAASANPKPARRRRAAPTN